MLFVALSVIDILLMMSKLTLTLKKDVESFSYNLILSGLLFSVCLFCGIRSD